MATMQAARFSHGFSKLQLVSPRPLRIKADLGGGGKKVLLVPVTLVLAPGSAKALTAADVAGSFSKAQEFAGQVTSTVGSAYGTITGTVREVFRFVKPVVDVAVPVVQETTETAIKLATPLVNEVGSQAVKALEAAGINTKPVVEVGQTAADVAGKAAETTITLVDSAKPAVSSTLQSLLTSDPLTLAGEGAALVLFFIFGPSILSSLGYAFRGYKGELTAPQALDYVSTGNYTLIDIRTEKEKSKSGIPSLPNNAKKRLIPLSMDEFSGKLRSQLRNPRAAEAEIAAIKISFLKKVNKGSNIIVLDSTGNTAKNVAKSLSALGFKKTWVVLDGFDGGRGWVQSRLGTETYNLSFGEVLSPSRILSPASNVFKAASSSDIFDVGSRPNKLLPSGD